MMTSPAPPAVDNRRVLARVMTHEILRSLTALARGRGGDMIELLVFSGIWSANTQHLLGVKGRYVEQTDIPPDSQRRPVSQADLTHALCMPDDIVARYVDKLIEDGIVERMAGGLVVPSAVFTQREMMDSNNEVYMRAMSLVSALREAGFQLGEAA